MFRQIARSEMLLIFCLFAVVLLAGCHGGGVSTGDQPDGDGMSNAETVTAVQDYGEQYVQMLNDGMTIIDALQALANQMEASGDFSAVEVDGSGQVVWAEFTNGWPFAVLGNRTQLADQITDERAQPTATVDSAAAVELPAVQNAVLLNGFGRYRPEAAAAIDDIDNMLSRRGYQVNQQTVTVTELQNLGSPGVVFINSHAAAPRETSIGRPALWLDEAISQEAAGRYAARGWNDNEYMTLLSTSETDPDTGEKVKVQNFGVTDLFIARFVNLGNNSVVFSQSCSSGVEQMREAWLAAGAGVYGGWSDWCAGSAAPKYFFDRMAAANQYRPESPKQRPFDWQFVYTDMQDHDLHRITIDPGMFGGLAGGVNARVAILHFYSNDDTGILAPTISYMEMKEPGSELIIYGVFGTRQGEVTVGGTQVVVQNWSGQQITCTLPTEGPGSAGPVIVKVGDRESNQANLTDWRGDFSFTWDLGIGSLGVDFDLQPHWRADLRKFRAEPGAEPIQREPRFFELASDSTGTWRAYGENPRRHPDGHTTNVMFKGSGTLNYYHSQYADATAPAQLPSLNGGVNTKQAYPFPTLGEPGIAGFGFIRPEQNDIQFALLGRADITVEAYHNGGLQDRSTMPVEIPVVGPDFHDGFFPSQFPYMRFTMDSSYHVNGGKKVMAEQEMSWELQWSSIFAEYGPNPDHER